MIQMAALKRSLPAHHTASLSSGCVFVHVVAVPWCIMRLVRGVRGGGEESAPSSWQSNSSYGIFGSACSDMSDCECGAEDHHYETYKSPFCSHSASFSSAVNCGERTPLLAAARSDPEQTTYNTISSSDSLGPGEISGRDIIETYKRLEKENKSEPERRQSSLVTM
ncbi:hypothetical protein RR46_00995 [Papilio xuthus]|uniref:Uncharacterized protein n=1 Tax=Papilio xuthus TaxID=66420 RepID=A0A0N1IAB9_PAPXU|nr:hypothetical protein RR46_00995 [Papilio xuthus]